jgi:hypothetical protein
MSNNSEGPTTQHSYCGCNPSKVEATLACRERHLDPLLNFLAVLKAHGRKVRTTDVIANTESCDRIVLGVVSHLNRSRKGKPVFPIYTNFLTLPHAYTARCTIEITSKHHPTVSLPRI